METESRFLFRCGSTDSEGAQVKDSGRNHRGKLHWSSSADNKQERKQSDAANMRVHRSVCCLYWALPERLARGSGRSFTLTLHQLVLRQSFENLQTHCQWSTKAFAFKINPLWRNSCKEAGFCIRQVLSNRRAKRSASPGCSKLLLVTFDIATIVCKEEKDRGTADEWFSGF